MVTQFLITLGALTVMMAGWLGLQAWARRSEQLGSDCDMLEGRFGCAGCVLSGKCKMDTDDIKPPRR